MNATKHLYISVHIIVCMTKRISITMRDRVHERLLEKKPQGMSISEFAEDLIATQLEKIFRTRGGYK